MTEEWSTEEEGSVIFIIKECGIVHKVFFLPIFPLRMSVEFEE
jgi:hypothetical protein